MKSRIHFLAIVLKVLSNGAKVSGTDCGCPETCTPEALAESNGAAFGCGARIEFLMKRYDLPEANACAAASHEGPYVPLEENDRSKPCRYEACHPVGCRSKLAVVPEFHLLHNCGCPETCNDDTLDETLPNKPFNCRERIHFMVHRHHNSEWDACEMASDEGYCDTQRCRPDQCGSTLDRPTTQPHLSASPPVQYHSDKPSNENADDQPESVPTDKSTLPDGDTGNTAEPASSAENIEHEENTDNTAEPASSAENIEHEENTSIWAEISEEVEEVSSRKNATKLVKTSPESLNELNNDENNIWNELSEEVENTEQNSYDEEPQILMTSEEVENTEQNSYDEEPQILMTSDSSSNKTFHEVSGIVFNFISFVLGAATATLLAFLVSHRASMFEDYDSIWYPEDTLPSYSMHGSNLSQDGCEEHQYIGSNLSQDGSEEHQDMDDYVRQMT